MTLTRKQIEDEILTATLAAGSNTRVIYYYPNAPRPKLPYTSIAYKRMVPADPSTFFNKQTNLVEYRACYEMVYEFDFYSEDQTQAFDEAHKFLIGMKKKSVRMNLNKYLPISVWNTTEPFDSSILIDSSFETRCTLEVVFNVMLEDGSTTDDVGYIETIGDIIQTNKP